MRVLLVTMTHIVYNITFTQFSLFPFLFCVTELEQTVLAFCFLKLALVVSVLIYVVLRLTMTRVLYDPLPACPI